MAVLVIFLILLLLAFLFGGHILVGLIFIAPILLIFYLCSVFNLPEFIPDFLIAGIIIAGACYIYKLGKKQELKEKQEKQNTINNNKK